MASIFRLFRLILFGVASFFAALVIILGALITNYTVNVLNLTSNSVLYGLATGALTILTLPVMKILSIVRKGAFTSMIAVEITWIGILWIMWLAVGAALSSNDNFTPTECTDLGLIGLPRAKAACNEILGMTALGYLTWILLLVYHIILLVLAFRKHMRGYTDVWTADVSVTEFNAPDKNINTQVVHDGKVAYPNQYVAQQQVVYSPQQVPSPYPQQQFAGSYPPQAQPDSSTPPAGTSPYPQV